MADTVEIGAAELQVIEKLSLPVLDKIVDNVWPTIASQKASDSTIPENYDGRQEA